MAKISVNQFAGAIPALSPDKVPQPYCQEARNCDFVTGQISPGKSISLLKTLYTPYRRSFYKIADNVFVTWANDSDIVRHSVVDAAVRFYFTTGDGLYKTNQALATSDANESNWPTTVYPGGVAKPEQALTVEAIDDPEEENSDTIKFDTTYRYTRVTIWGEESEPSPPILWTCYMGRHPRLANFDAGDDPNVEKFRIYRELNGSQQFAFYRVDEVDATSDPQYYYDDTKTDADLSSEIMKTLEWEAPPAVVGLASGPNNTMMSWKDSTLYLSEPDFPHAWPYKHTLPDTIVSAHLVSQDTIIALTSGKHYVLAGRIASAMSRTPISHVPPALSKRSSVVTPIGLVFASTKGIAVITQTGGNVISQGLFTEKQWNALVPQNFTFLYKRGWLYAISTGIAGSQASFKMDMTNPTNIISLFPRDFSLTIESAQCDGNDITFLATSPLGSQAIYTLDGADPSEQFFWKSAKFRFLPEVNFSCCMMRCTGNITFRLYSERASTPIIEKVCDGDAVFRLPAGFTAHNYHFTVQGTGSLDEVIVATSMMELGYA